MVAHPDNRRRTMSAARFLASAALSCAFVYGPAHAAAGESEPLEEDFLLFLSDWSDTSGEFVAPSEVEALLPEKNTMAQSGPDKDKSDGEAEEGGDSDD